MSSKENVSTTPTKLGSSARLESTPEHPKPLAERDSNTETTNTEYYLLHGASDKANIPHKHTKTLSSSSSISNYSVKTLPRSESDSTPRRDPALLLPKPTNQLFSNYSHFKSPSLGNIFSTPTQDPNTPTPPTVRCRKRTNTLSATPVPRPRPLAQAFEEEHLANSLTERRGSSQIHAAKRHAIYTQSLYVPFMEQNEIDETSQEQVSGTISESSSASSSGYNLNALGLQTPAFTPPPLSSFQPLPLQLKVSESTRRTLLTSRSSSSIVIEPAIKERYGPASSHHHPIIENLLADLDRAIMEWSIRGSARLSYGDHCGR